jgi:hypothetical protein
MLHYTYNVCLVITYLQQIFLTNAIGPRAEFHNFKFTRMHKVSDFYLRKEDEFTWKT